VKVREPHCGALLIQDVAIPSNYASLLNQSYTCELELSLPCIYKAVRFYVKMKLFLISNDSDEFLPRLLRN
jgi:hypothetical protein